MTQTQTIASRPLCVGRFLIDVPPDAKVTWTRTSTSGTAGTISALTSVAKTAFRSKMDGIEAELRKAPHQTEGSRLSEVVRPDDSVWIFRYRKSEVGARVYQIDGYHLSGDTLYTVNSSSSNDGFHEGVQAVQRGLTALQFREIWAIPTEPGFCFDHGFLPGRRSTFEATGVQISSAQFPGVMIAFETQTNEQGKFPGPDLIARTEQGQDILEPSRRATLLRKNPKRSVGGRFGQEMMLKRQPGGGLQLSGSLEINAEPGRIDAPGIVFSLVLDPPAKPGEMSTKEEDAMKLWDTIVDSVRLRPGAL